jgi:uncharacterized protein YjlB
MVPVAVHRAAAIKAAATNSASTSTSSSSNASARIAWNVLERIQFTPSKCNQGCNCSTIPIYRMFLQPQSDFPNNPHHPLLQLKGAFPFPHSTTTKPELHGHKLLTQAGWTSPWIWGIYPFHHYHTTAWELVVCLHGEAQVQLGGSDTGPIVDITKGDIVLTPPGVAHKQLKASEGFVLMGSHPAASGTHVDIVKGPPTEPATTTNFASVDSRGRTHYGNFIKRFVLNEKMLEIGK